MWEAYELEDTELYDLWHDGRIHSYEVTVDEVKRLVQEDNQTSYTLIHPDGYRMEMTV